MTRAPSLLVALAALSVMLLDGCSSPACQRGWTLCGTVCSDVQTDLDNCGACGTVCGAGFSCVAGACQVVCPPGQLTCTAASGPTCVDAKIDPSNCGACGHACGAGTLCQAGSCVATCSLGSTPCPSTGTPTYCANVSSDEANCGACGHACASGVVCVAGACVVECPPGELACTSDGGLICVNQTIDRSNCGACGNACAVGQLCEAGSCVLNCSAGESVCPTSGPPTYCADLASDDGNCGQCGHACGAGLSCVASACEAVCPAGQSLCGTPDGGTGCTNTLDDGSNCGACGNACGPGLSCVTGFCEAACPVGQTLCGPDGGAVCTNLLDDPGNCGACGNACAGNASCLAGFCFESGITPVPPSATDFMWQQVQTQFTPSCTTNVTLSLGPNAVCWAGSDGNLRCAGKFGGVSSNTFVPVASNVDQVLVSGAYNSVCIHKTDGTAWCQGQNAHGEFADGNSTPTTSFVQWGAASNLFRLGTGTWDQMCSIDAAGAVRCAGYNFGTSPVLQGDAGVVYQSFWGTTFGTVNLDDPTVYRASDSRAECTIGSAGLTCGGTNLGGAGTVVSGGPTGYGNTNPCPAGDYNVVTLNSSGVASLVTFPNPPTCTPTPTRMFARESVVAIGYSLYASSLCAVYVDGSLWCIGSDANGQLGTGGTSPLAVETQVAPPGSVAITCH